MVNTNTKIKKELNQLKNLPKAKILQGFFKTGKGQYGEGDIFLGLTSAQIKDVAKIFYQETNLTDLKQLLKSKIHEERMVALRILIWQYNHGNKKQQEEIFKFYLANATNINNWDLVDISAPNIVGDYLLNQNRQILYKLAKSDNLWQKRIAIISTFTFIRHHDFKDTFKIALILLQDRHDLIHKAVGWMLREVGKKNETELTKNFLDKYSGQMPRTMLRYSIERFSDKKRKFYLNK